MKRHPADAPTTRLQLRQQAEAALQQTPQARLDGPEAALQRLIHELQIHQAELAIQNEALRRQQVALTAARDQYAALYDLAPVGYLTLEASGEILEANLTAATLLGVPRRSLVGTSLTRAILPNDQDAFYFHRRRVFETQTTQTCNLRMQRPDGTVFVACLASRTLAEETGSATRCLTTLSDITARVQAEEALRASEACRQAILGAALCGIITMDERGHIGIADVILGAIGPQRAPLTPSNAKLVGRCRIENAGGCQVRASIARTGLRRLGLACIHESSLVQYEGCAAASAERSCNAWMARIIRCKAMSSASWS